MRSAVRLAGQYPLSRTRLGKTPLDVACERGHYALVQLLFSNPATAEAVRRHLSDELVFDDVRLRVAVGAEDEAPADPLLVGASATTTDLLSESSSLAALGIGYVRSTSRQSLLGGGSLQLQPGSVAASPESPLYVRSPSASLVSSGGSGLALNLQQQQQLQADQSAQRGLNLYPYPHFGGSSQSLLTGLEAHSASNQNAYQKQTGSLHRRMASVSPSPCPSIGSASSALGSSASGTSSKRSSLHLCATSSSSPFSLLRPEPRRFTCLHLAARNGHVDVLACEFCSPCLISFVFPMQNLEMYSSTVYSV